MTLDREHSINVLKELDVNTLRSAYMGRPGCACGCRGTYYYAREHQAESGMARGYTVHDEEVNDAKIKSVLRGARQAASLGAIAIAYTNDNNDVTCVCVETKRRLYILTVRD